MGREAECYVNFSPDSRPSIQNAPHDLPEGEYVFTFKNGSIGFRKNQGIWIEEV
jgi:hypothetical protein